MTIIRPVRFYEKWVGCLTITASILTLGIVVAAVLATRPGANPERLGPQLVQLFAFPLAIYWVWFLARKYGNRKR